MCKVESLKDLEPVVFNALKEAIKPKSKAGQVRKFARRAKRLVEAVKQPRVPEELTRFDSASSKFDEITGGVAIHPFHSGSSKSARNPQR